MDKKEKKIISIIKDYLLEGEEYKAKKYAIEYLDYIQDGRSKDFDKEYEKLESQIDWTPGLYESDYDYNIQENRVSDNPEIK